MKPFRHAFFVLAIAGSLAIGINAGAASTGIKSHPCASEHKDVVAACKNGDPCSSECRQAHKAMKDCRVANNLPKKSSGEHKGKGCKSHIIPAPTAPQPLPESR